MKSSSEVFYLRVEGFCEERDRANQPCFLPCAMQMRPRIQAIDLCIFFTKRAQYL